MTPFKRSPSRRLHTRRAVALVSLAVASVAATACGADPFAYQWTATQDTVLLYSLARPELNLYSAFDFYNRNRVRVESATSTGTWDVAVDTRDGKIVLVTPGTFGAVSKARIAVLAGKHFLDVTDAPSDTTLYTIDPVPMAMGNVYVVRTGQSVGAYGTPCVYYAKLEPVDIDPVGGTLHFEFDSSPVCNDRRLIPPK